MNIIETDELNKNLNSFTILDSRWKLGENNFLNSEYIKGHIPGAIKMDLEKFSNLESKFPHMIPSKSYFENMISKLGININDKIVIYDQTGFLSSARIWFLLKIFGFVNLQILNGGYKRWVEKKFEIQTNENKKKRTKTSGFFFQKNIIANKKFVKEASKNEKFQIIDARSSERFLGLVEEPRKNVKKGNILGSINIPFYKIHNKNGLILNNKDLEALFRNNYIDLEKKIICLCGSGVTACNIIFALNRLSCNDYYLYDGSWSEWGYVKR